MKFFYIQRYFNYIVIILFDEKNNSNLEQLTEWEAGVRANVQTMFEL